MSSSSFSTWVESIEKEFWAAHNEVMEATGLRRFLDGVSSARSSSSSDGGESFFQFMRSESHRFFSAVNWSEPFFRYLAAFHVVVVLAVLAATWGPISDERLIGVCVLLTCVVLAGTLLNSVGSRYAASLFVEADVNYFTEDGVFIAVVYMLPLIVLIVCLQIRMGCRVVKLMLQVKRAQVRQKLRRAAKAAPSAESAEATAEEAKKNQ